MTTSCLYVGNVSHTRHQPRRHAFRYPMSMLYLDLDELASMPNTPWFGVEALRPLSFRRRDYLGDPKVPLKQAVQDEVERALGVRPQGPIRLLTQVRAFGYSFNPVSFYYCFDADGERLVAVVAEITNTPWAERHRYVLASDGHGAHQTFGKSFHVSPFFPMTQRYDWHLSPPGPHLKVAMANLESERVVFQAGLVLERRPLSASELARAALRLLPMGWGTHAAIYAQAFRLWVKRTPFFSHPRLEIARKEEVP